jgi:hypothetical protein
MEDNILNLKESHLEDYHIHEINIWKNKYYEEKQINFERTLLGSSFLKEQQISFEKMLFGKTKKLFLKEQISFEKYFRKNGIRKIDLSWLSLPLSNKCQTRSRIFLTQVKEIEIERKNRRKKTHVILPFCRSQLKHEKNMKKLIIRINKKIFN